MLAYDPSDSASGAGCVEFLKENGIRISQKLGAKLIRLARSGVQLTLAALEDCPPGSDQEKAVLSIRPGDGNGEFPDDMRAAVEEAGFSHVIEDGVFKIISEYEEPDEAGEEEGQASAGLPAVRRDAAMLVRQQSITANSLLNDRKYIEELAFDFLDSEDEDVICRNMRKLARISMMSGQNPENIFISAFKKDSESIWAKTADLIAEMKDKEFGENLASMIRDADSRGALVRIAAAQCLESGDEFRKDVFLYVLSRLVSKTGDTELITKNATFMSRLYAESPSTLAELADAIPDMAAKSDPQIFKKFRSFMSDLSEKTEVIESLDRELRAVRPDEEKICYLWFLSSFKGLSADARRSYSETAAELMRGEVKSIYQAEMLKTVLKNFHPESMEETIRLACGYEDLTEEAKRVTFDLWEELYADDPPSEISDAIRGELRDGSDPAIRRILSSPLILKCRPGKAANQKRIVSNAAALFASDKTGELQKRLPDLISEITERPCETFIGSVEQGRADEDDIRFASSLFTSSWKRGKADPNEILRFLRGFNGRLRLKAMEEEAKIHHDLKIGGEDAAALLEESMSDGVPAETKFATAIPLLSLIPPEKAEETVVGMLSELDSCAEFEKACFIEKMTEAFRTDPVLSCHSSVIRAFMKKNAVRMTMPSMNMKMRMSEESIKSNMYMSRYESEKWSWENCGQTMFAASALLARSDCPEETARNAASLIIYAARHWARGDEDFLISDGLVLRIMRECAESARSVGGENLKGLVAEMKKAALSRMESKGSAGISENRDYEEALEIIGTLD